MTYRQQLRFAERQERRESLRHYNRLTLREKLREDMDFVRGIESRGLRVNQRRVWSRAAKLAGQIVWLRLRLLGHSLRDVFRRVRRQMKGKR